MPHPDWPALSLAEWEPTYRTLHRFTQILGKIRLAHAPAINHWWHVPLYVSSAGLTTSSMPIGRRQLTLTLDFCAHLFVAHTSDKRVETFRLEPMTVAEFYRQVLSALSKLDVSTKIWPVPVEMMDATPFTEDMKHASYDRRQVERLHQILINIDRVFSTFRGGFLGKCSPVHFFWGAFDLAVTRFSGRRNPTPPEDPMEHEAYSHEVISHGFWPGGDWPIGGRVEEAVFYAYAMPPLAELRRSIVEPKEAFWSDQLSEFLLPYEAVRQAADPDGALLSFMQSTYLAAAKPAGWNIEELQHK